MSVCRPCIVRQESVFARVKSVARPWLVHKLVFTCFGSVGELCYNHLHA